MLKNTDEINDFEMQIYFRNQRLLTLHNYIKYKKINKYKSGAF